MGRYLDKFYDYFFYVKPYAEEWESWHQQIDKELKRLKRNLIEIPKEISDVTEKKYYSWLSDELVKIFKKERADIHKQVEVGCGSGALSFYLARHIGTESTLIDNSDIVLEYASLLFKRGGSKFIPFLMREDVLGGLKEENNYFDFVHSTGLIEHFSPENIEIIVKEIKRVTKIGGYIFLAVPNYFSPDIIYIWSKYGKGTERYLSVDSLRSIALKSQLEIVRAGHCQFVFSNNIGKFIPSFVERIIGRFGLGFLNYVICKKIES